MDPVGLNQVNSSTQDLSPPSSPKINPSSELANKIYQPRLVRWTAGRISCCIRLPFYLIFTVCQAIKIAGKSLIAVGLYFANVRDEACSLEGIKKDYVMLKSLGRRALTSLFCFVFAPPKDTKSLFYGLGAVHHIVFSGNYHSEDLIDLKRCYYASKVCFSSLMLQSDCLKSELSKKLDEELIKQNLGKPLERLNLSVC